MIFELETSVCQDNMPSSFLMENLSKLEILDQNLGL
jgi:hypothetical protein